MGVLRIFEHEHEHDIDTIIVRCSGGVQIGKAVTIEASMISSHSRLYRAFRCI
jgi:hypothetical protein